MSVSLLTQASKRSFILDFSLGLPPNLPLLHELVGKALHPADKGLGVSGLSRQSGLPVQLLKWFLCGHFLHWMEGCQMALRPVETEKLRIPAPLPVIHVFANSS